MWLGQHWPGTLTGSAVVPGGQEEEGQEGEMSCVWGENNGNTVLCVCVCVFVCVRACVRVRADLECVHCGGAVHRDVAMPPMYVYTFKLQSV